MLAYLVMPSMPSIHAIHAMAAIHTDPGNLAHPPTHVTVSVTRVTRVTHEDMKEDKGRKTEDGR